MQHHLHSHFQSLYASDQLMLKITDNRISSGNVLTQKYEQQIQLGQFSKL